MTSDLLKQLKKTFGVTKSLEILNLFETLKENPKKGKEVGRVGNIVIKELKYESFRFYFLCDNFKIKFLKIDEIKDLIIKFVKMSKKNNQQEVIEEIKLLLKKLGFEKI